jgi:hypothetical protein
MESLQRCRCGTVFNPGLGQFHFTTLGLKK